MDKSEETAPEVGRKGIEQIVTCDPTPLVAALKKAGYPVVRVHPAHVQFRVYLERDEPAPENFGTDTAAAIKKALGRRALRVVDVQDAGE